MDVEEYRDQAVEELRHQAAGGWRRAVTGLAVGAGLGWLIVLLSRRTEAPPATAGGQDA